MNENVTKKLTVYVKIYLDVQFDNSLYKFSFLTCCMLPGGFRRCWPVTVESILISSTTEFCSSSVAVPILPVYRYSTTII